MPSPLQATATSTSSPRTAPASRHPRSSSTSASPSRPAPSRTDPRGQRDPDGSHRAGPVLAPCGWGHGAEHATPSSIRLCRPCVVVAAVPVFAVASGGWGKAPMSPSVWDVSRPPFPGACAGSVLVRGSPRVQLAPAGLSHGQEESWCTAPRLCRGAGPPQPRGSEAGAKQIPGLGRAGRGAGARCPPPCSALRAPGPHSPRDAPGQHHVINPGRVLSM